jgi:hypothetical protein
MIATVEKMIKKCEKDMFKKVNHIAFKSRTWRSEGILEQNAGSDASHDRACRHDQMGCLDRAPRLRWERGHPSSLKSAARAFTIC